jgi:hypothetical protein
MNQMKDYANKYGTSSFTTFTTFASRLLVIVIKLNRCIIYFTRELHNKKMGVLNLLHFTTFASLCLAFLKIWKFSFLHKKKFMLTNDSPIFQIDTIT